MNSRLTVMALLLLVLGCCACSGSGRTDEQSGEGTPGAAVVSFFDHLNAGHLDAARELYTTDARVVVEDNEVFRGWADEVTQQGTIESVEILASTVTDDTAAVQFAIVFADGTSREHTVECLNEDGTWRLGAIL
ncbi:MAG TPA: DUF4878 domain-containing protein [Candidatus Polarisedimenticolaceae bacterium]|nr:DUF4878 domain-containing protein [Candidatus Polarisedimenticolaceae bacterium]